MAVLKEIGPKLIQPLSAFSKGGGSRGDSAAERPSGSATSSVLRPRFTRWTDRRIGNDDGCGLKAGQIEGFGGGHTGDAVVSGSSRRRRRKEHSLRPGSVRSQ